MKSLTITKPDDWHLHLRDGEMLDLVAPLSRDFERALIMPNLVPPVTTVEAAKSYKSRIENAGFARPMMSLYLTEDMNISEITRAKDSGIILAIKLYPAGATTNSASGVKSIDKIMPILEEMAKLGLPLCIHGEVVEAQVDIFDREKRFIDEILDPIRQKIPELKVTMEHITTSDAVDYVLDNPINMGATITTHHLLLDRNDLLVGGLKPHFYCLPILKRNSHKEALQKAAISGDTRFFLGTDSAPHPLHKKEAECCAAGVFSAVNTMAWLAQFFEEMGALEQLEDFTSHFGAKHYDLPINSGKICLEKHDKPQEFPRIYEKNDIKLHVFDPARPLFWRVANSERE